MAFIKWQHHIFVKISRILLVLLLLAAALQVLFFGFFWSRLTEEHNQLSNFGAAANIAQQLYPVINPVIDHAELRQRLYYLSQMLPHSEIYLLDSSGHIQFSFLRRIELATNRVSLEPIQTFLQPDAAQNLPLKGGNPRNLAETTIFSAAPVKIAGSPGYVYVVLTTAGYLRVGAILRGTYMILSAVGIVGLSILISGGIGVFLFFLLTRRLARLSTVVSKFQEGDYTSRASVGAADELGQLESVFNSMADALVAALETIKENDRLRRVFISNISHDLRTPITSARGCLQTIALKQVPLREEDREDLICTALSSIESLGRMVNDLFELSRLEAREAAPEFLPFSLLDTLKEIHDKLTPLAEEKAVSFVLDIPGEIPETNGDEHLLQRAISNLAENALIYTGAGGSVTVRAKVTSGLLVVEVEDSGPGIAADELPHIFDRFYRGKSSRREQPSGTGLGLAITKQILERHGSAIEVESKLGQGTTFRFSLSPL